MPLKNQPAALVLTRQNLPTLDRTKYAPAAGLQRGGYVLADAADGKPEVILIGTGSEVSLCVAAYEKLTAEGVKARVVSLPCWELFDAQPAEYRDAVLPPDVTRRVAVELGVKQGWEQVHRPVRPVHRHVRLRRVGPGRRAAEALRLHGRERRGRGEEAVRKVGRQKFLHPREPDATLV